MRRHAHLTLWNRVWDTVREARGGVTPVGQHKKKAKERDTNEYVGWCVCVLKKTQLFAEVSGLVVG